MVFLIAETFAITWPSSLCTGLSVPWMPCPTQLTLRFLALQDWHEGNLSALQMQTGSWERARPMTLRVPPSWMVAARTEFRGSAPSAGTRSCHALWSAFPLKLYASRHLPFVTPSKLIKYSPANFSSSHESWKFPNPILQFLQRGFRSF